MWWIIALALIIAPFVKTWQEADIRDRIEAERRKRSREENRK